jgi:polar amino acid transport system substrate-binding protein
MTVDQKLVQEIAPTGRLRAALNMGNPVLAHSHTQPGSPAGVTIDLSREFAALLGVEVDFLQCAHAGESGNAVADGQADVAFLAIDPLRAERLVFTAPYVQIEGCYLVRADASMRSAADVDSDGVQVLVGEASAYALFLQRHLKAARLTEVKTSEEVVDAFVANPGIPVAAGVRQQLEADMARHHGLRLLPEPFMVIQQGVAMARTRSSAAHQLLEDFMARQRGSGAIGRALERHGMEGVTVLA